MPTIPDSTASDSVNWVKVGLGALFVLMALRQWRSRPRHGETPTMPKWLQAVGAFTPLKAGGLGIGLSALNPKNLALTLAAAGSIAQAGLSDGESAIAVLVYVVLASLTVAGPLVFFLVAPHAASKPLDSMKQFMSDHNAAIMVVVLLVLGAKLIGDGIGGLGS
jgi:threonine/homoserine/homoserine lactone efflux protein